MNGQTNQQQAAPARAAHTPGPWQANADPMHDRGEPWTIWTSEGPGHGAVAIVAPYCPHRKGEPEYAVKCADARIIAAAPAIVDAMQSMVNVARDIIGAYSDVVGTESEPGWIEDLREATEVAGRVIASATGGRP